MKRAFLLLFISLIQTNAFKIPSVPSLDDDNLPIKTDDAFDLIDDAFVNIADDVFDRIDDRGGPNIDDLPSVPDISLPQDDEYIKFVQNFNITFMNISDIYQDLNSTVDAIEYINSTGLIEKVLSIANGSNLDDFINSASNIDDDCVYASCDGRQVVE